MNVKECVGCETPTKHKLDMTPDKHKLVWLRNTCTMHAYLTSDLREEEVRRVQYKIDSDYCAVVDYADYAAVQQAVYSGRALPFDVNRAIARYVESHLIEVPEWVTNGSFHWVYSEGGVRYGDLRLSGGPGDNRVLCKRVEWTGELTCKKLQRVVDALMREETK